MLKGFILYKDNKIPFVIDGFRVELFSDNSCLSEFINEYRSKSDFILNGVCLGLSTNRRPITLYVERILADTLYLHCYIIKMSSNSPQPNTIGFESPYLDDIFRYKYNYLDMIRDGISPDLEPKDIYRFPFNMNDCNYQSVYHIGRDARLGLLEDFNKKGELRISLQNKDIQECNDLSVVINRLSKFITSDSESCFKRITLYNNGINCGWFYSPSVIETATSAHDVTFCNFEVMRFVPKILNNLAIDSGSKIVNSIPLGHIGDSQSLFSPQRFIEQIMAFEYIYDKIEHTKAQDTHFPLKKELEEQFDSYPCLLSNSGLSSEDVSERIKEVRRRVAHGYEYWYDFCNNREIQRMMTLLDMLIKRMSMNYIGFTDEEINDYCQQTGWL